MRYGRRWWVGRVFVGYAFGTSRWTVSRLKTGDGDPFLAVSVGTLAFGVGFAIGSFYPARRRKERRDGEAKFQKIIAEMRVQP